MSKKEEKKKNINELSEEDKELKTNIELMVTRLKDTDTEIRSNALNMIITLVQTATSSITGLPKPLKFLADYYVMLKEIYDLNMPSPFKKSFADLMSMLAMTNGKEGENESLKYLLQGHKEDPTKWGHEYLRSLAGEIVDMFKTSPNMPELADLVNIIFRFFIEHNSEPDAIDLLLEVEMIKKIIPFANAHNFLKICKYLLSCSLYAADCEDYQSTLEVIYEIYLNQKKYTDAMIIALKSNKKEFIDRLFKACPNEGVYKIMRKQMAIFIGRSRIPYTIVNDKGDIDEELMSISSNDRLIEYFQVLIKDLDLWDTRSPEDIFKLHLEERKGQAIVDSARYNLVRTYVNGFANACFGNDRLLTVSTKDADEWIYKNKEIGCMAAAATYGVIKMWDVANGLSDIDRFISTSNDKYVIAGGYLAIGILNAGIRNEIDPYEIMTEKFNEREPIVKMGIMEGLAIAFAGRQKQEALELLVPLIVDPSTPIDQCAMACLALGHIYLSTCHEDVGNAIMQALISRQKEDFEKPISKFISLSLGLLYLNQEDKIEPIMMAIDVIDGKLKDFLKYSIIMCAYAGTGNVLKIQEMLHVCAEHLDPKEKINGQVIAVLGVAAISFGEQIGIEMSMRMMHNLLQYGEPVIRKMVPLAIGLLYLCNPQISVMDTLIKLSNDTDNSVAFGAIFALGLIGAGTKNSRLDDALRQLAGQKYSNEQFIFLIRLAQGILHLSKGLVTIHPIYHDKTLLCKPALAGILTVLLMVSEMDEMLFGNYHYLLFFITEAMYPRMAMALDENLKPAQTQIRVGEAVDVVGQAGKPRAITGFQTHNSPVLLAQGERAEIANDDMLSNSTTIENIFIVQINKDAENKI